VLRESNQHIPEALWVMSRSNVRDDRRFKGRGGGYGFNNHYNNNNNNTNNNGNSYSRDNNTFNGHIGQRPQVPHGAIHSSPATNTIIPPWSKPYTNSTSITPSPYWQSNLMQQQQQQWPQSGNGVQLPINIVHPIQQAPNNITTSKHTGFSPAGNYVN